MAEKIFVSPGVFTSEKDLSFVAQQVGVTTLGSVGETVKGPAFEPIFITNYDEFVTIFGGQNPEKFDNNKPKYELPYIAKSYLSQSNQLFVTRILGLTGYDAGQAWILTANANYNPSTTGITSSGTWSADITTGSTYDNITDPNVEYLFNLIGQGVITNNPTNPILVPNDTATYPLGIVFDKVGGSFTGVSATIDFVDYTTGPNTGTTSGTVTTWTASSYTEYEGMVLAMLRSRGSYSVDTLNFTTTGLTMSTTGVDTNPLQTFMLSATTATGTLEYEVSMDRNSRNYITRVLGVEHFDKSSTVFVEEHYPELLEKLIDDGYILGLTPGLVDVTSDFENYHQEWQTPETPWVVSELRGNMVDKLFKFISISDGSSANKEIKISIQNIKPDTKEFDVVIRDYYDIDSRPSILESFRKCNMDPTSDNYIARKIGTADGEFSLRSRFIMIVQNPNAPIDAFPAGFEGYIVRDYPSGVLAPQPVYKTTYNPTAEKVRKVYLGFSNTTGFDQNLFNWKGYTNTSTPTQWTATTKGFHMDVDAGIAGNFEVGDSEFRTVNAIDADPLNSYQSLSSRKFTLTPYLGFDGWNSYRRRRTNEDRYKVGRVGFINGESEGEFELISQTEGTSDYYAYLQGIRTFANPEAVNINVFTTSNVEFGDNNDLVGEIVDMIEEERADSLYIMTSPEGVVPQNNPQLSGLGFDSVEVFSAEEIVDLLEDVDIDSNYTATYWPWIQKRDNENNVNVWLPPTHEVVRNIALTDNVAFPWFASAGYTRGLTSALQARVKLTEADRDVLYEGRINPMATFSDQGVIIWGNKNLQVADSLLNRINVRRLLLQTRKLISAVAIRLLFEQNDQIVRNQFLTLVNPILENIKRERGLSDFRVVLSNDPEEIDRNELRGKIFIKPITSLEFIVLEFNVTPTGASFDDI
jgi:hypothetical protein